MSSNWFRRRWFDFRLGHSVYLIFLLSFSNFILIFHRLLIERVEFLNDIFSELWMFIVLFVVIYFPISIAVGAWHRKTQIKIENEQALLNNPFMARNFRMMIDIIEGKASKDEVQKFREFLTKIEKKSDSEF
ncbi:hypothetical protein [Nitrosopumilus sp.]|uniref:hypothetical protein n=1 Tax=Nitrosopumilus sp. TaxID=2024843 RepID=UPI00292DCBE1|nr:hypothetical protein [Nitrosopumilus sp.]